MTSAAPRSLRIFLVENNEDTLKYFRMYLEDMGHVVAQARTLAEALAGVPAADCDVLISDVSLADGTGWDLLRLLRERGLAHPGYAIAMSGFGMKSDREKSAEVGYRHHLIKPFEPEELDAMLEEAALELPG